MEPIDFHKATFACPCVLSDRPPMLWWLSPGKGWDAVTWCGWGKLKKGRNYWKSLKEQVSSIWANMFDDYVCYLASHDYPSFLERESHGILLL